MGLVGNMVQTILNFAGVIVYVGYASNNVNILTPFDR